MHILHFGYNIEVINSFQDDMYLWIIVYSIFYFILLHNFASNIVIIAQDM